MVEAVHLTHLKVPELPCMLLLDLEAIEWVMAENKNEKLKGKGKASTARADAKDNPNRIESGGLSDQVPKKACSEKFC